MLYTAIIRPADYALGISTFPFPFTGRHRIRITSWQTHDLLGYPYYYVTSRTVVNPMQPDFLYILTPNLDQLLTGSVGWARSGWFECDLAGVCDFQLRTPTLDIYGGQGIAMVTFEIEKI